ncbi:MAG TPA: hypothetical protein VLH15_04295 [Dehalococcoidales bacterium]|nr:hypothetical protein [Dehalococcoidales bacterium]
MNWIKQFGMLILSVFLIMVVIYVIRRIGTGIPVVDNVVRTVWN